MGSHAVEGRADIGTDVSKFMAHRASSEKQLALFWVAGLVDFG